MLDFAFEFEYEPILFVLYRREYTWVGCTEKGKVHKRAQKDIVQFVDIKKKESCTSSKSYLATTATELYR